MVNIQWKDTKEVEKENQVPKTAIKNPLPLFMITLKLLYYTKLY